MWDEIVRPSPRRLACQLPAGWRLLKAPTDSLYLCIYLLRLAESEGAACTTTGEVLLCASPLPLNLRGSSWLACSRDCAASALGAGSRAYRCRAGWVWAGSLALVPGAWLFPWRRPLQAHAHQAQPHAHALRSPGPGRPQVWLSAWIATLAQVASHLSLSWDVNTRKLHSCFQLQLSGDLKPWLEPAAAGAWAARGSHVGGILTRGFPPVLDQLRDQFLGSRPTSREAAAATDAGCAGRTLLVAPLSACPLLPSVGPASGFSARGPVVSAPLSVEPGAAYDPQPRARPVPGKALRHGCACAVRCPGGLSAQLTPGTPARCAHESG